MTEMADFDRIMLKVDFLHEIIMNAIEYKQTVFKLEIIVKNLNELGIRTPMDFQKVGFLNIIDLDQNLLDLSFLK